MIYKILFVIITLACLVKSSIMLKETVIWYMNKVIGVFWFDVLACFVLEIMTFSFFIFSLLVALGKVIIKG